MTFEEYAYVELTEALDASLPIGTRGAVVMICPGSPPEYEVEFVDCEGETIAFRTMKGGQLRRVDVNTKAT